MLFVCVCALTDVNHPLPKRAALAAAATAKSDYDALVNELEATKKALLASQRRRIVELEELYIN